MLSNLQKIFTLIFLGLLFTTCRDTIEFAVPDTIKDAIFIEGKLSKGEPSTVFVKIGQVFNFTTNPSLFLADNVEIIDESGQALELTSKEQGIFKLAIPKDHPTFKIEYGHAYKIRLQLKNQAIYESTYDTLYQVPEMADLKSDKISKSVILDDGKRLTQEIVTLVVSSPLNSPNKSRPHLLWEIESVFKQSDSPEGFAEGIRPCGIIGREAKTCYLSINPVENYVSLNTIQLSGDTLIDFTVFEADNTNTFVFSEGHYTTIYQQSISDAAFEYWSQANQLTNRNGSIFEAPSGRIITNFYNVDNPKDEVYGYFFATESNFKRIYTSPAEAGYPRSHCPPIGGHSYLCDNCLCWPNSTTVKPDWWEE